MTETKELRYRVIGLEVSNFKRLKAVELAPVGNVVTVGGRNDQGKSSLLDSIMAVMAGAGFKCEQPLRRGAKEGQITLTLQKGDLTLVATKKYRANGSPSLVVTLGDVPASSPQKVLDALCQHICFDPLAFAHMESKQQVETLRQIVGLDFTEPDKERQRHYDLRTTVNRHLATQEAKLRGMAPAVEAPAEEVSAKELLGELTRANATNQANAKSRREVETAKESHTRIQTELESVEAKIKELTQEREDLVKVLENGQVRIAGLEIAVAKLEDVDVSAINARIENVDEINLKVRANQTRKDAKTALDGHRKEVDALTKKIEAIDAFKAKQLSEAKFPLAGLSFDDAGVLLDGVPFAQGGTAKKILASVAIAQALNPNLPAILIRDGSLLDEESMAALAGYAQEHDLQVWLELVGTSRACSVVIEDGEVRES